MGVIKTYSARCDFCGYVGDSADSEHDLRKESQRPQSKVRVIFTCFYGNEVWCCGVCLTTNKEAMEWKTLEEEKNK